MVTNHLKDTYTCWSFFEASEVQILRLPEAVKFVISCVLESFRSLCVLSKRGRSHSTDSTKWISTQPENYPNESFTTRSTARSAYRRVPQLSSVQGSAWMCPAEHFEFTEFSESFIVEHFWVKAGMKLKESNAVV